MAAPLVPGAACEVLVDGEWHPAAVRRVVGDTVDVNWALDGSRSDGWPAASVRALPGTFPAGATRVVDVPTDDWGGSPAGVGIVTPPAARAPQPLDPVPPAAQPRAQPAQQQPQPTQCAAAGAPGAYFAPVTKPGAGGGQQAFEEDEDEEDEKTLSRTVPVRALAEYFVHDIRREFTYRALIPFLIVLVLVSVNGALSFPIPSGAAVGYQVSQAVTEELFDTETANKVRSIDDWYAWLRGLTKRLFAPAGELQPAGASNLISTHRWLKEVPAERQNIPLYWLVVRQHRVVPEECGNSDQAAPISAAIWTRVQGNCLPEYRRSRLSAAAYRRSTAAAPFVGITSDAFSSDTSKAQASPMPPMKSARGLLRDYEGTGDQFTVVFPYQSMSAEDAEAVIADLDNNSWVDTATRMVVVEMLLFHPTAGTNALTGVYTVARMVLEVHYSGALTTLMTTRPFRLLLMGEWPEGLCFAFDIITFLYVPWLIRDAIWYFHTNHQLRPWTSYVGGLELLTLGHCAALFGALVLRFMAWDASSNMDRDMTAVSFYDKMLDYQDTYEFGRGLYTVALWLAWFRILEFLRYNSRLNAVTETLRLAAGDLLSLLIVTAIVLTSFALVGMSVYGRHLEVFSTLNRSFEFLVVAVFTGDVEGATGAYSRMRVLEPTITPVFILFFFAMMWLVLLNVVLGILATGFSAASQSAADRSWEMEPIRREFLEWKADHFGESGVPVKDMFWPFGSQFFKDRIAATRQLTRLLDTERRLFDEQQDRRIREGRAEWKRQSFNPNDVRRSKSEVVQLAEHPEWRLSQDSTAKGFDECILWWKGTLSDIASQQQAEKEEVRQAITDVGRRVGALTATVMQRLDALERRADQHQLQLRGDVHNQGTTTQGALADRYASHQHALGDLAEHVADRVVASIRASFSEAYGSPRSLAAARLSDARDARPR